MTTPMTKAIAARSPDRIDVENEYRQSADGHVEIAADFHKQGEPGAWDTTSVSYVNADTGEHAAQFNLKSLQSPRGAGRNAPETGPAPH